MILSSAWRSITISSQQKRGEVHSYSHGLVGIMTAERSVQVVLSTGTESWTSSQSAQGVWYIMEDTGDKRLHIPFICRRSAQEVFIDNCEEFRKLISDGGIRCMMEPHVMSAYCERLLKTRPAAELQLTLGEFRAQEVAKKNNEDPTRFQLFWDELYKYFMYAATVIEEMTTTEILQLVSCTREIPSSITLSVDFPKPPPGSCFVMFCKLERILNNELSDDELKERWDAMLPKDRIPLFEQYKLELIGFIENLHNFLLSTPNLSKQQRSYVESIKSRTATAADKVNDILGKLTERDVGQAAYALKYFRKVVGNYYGDIADKKERERTLLEDFEKLPKRIVAWMANAQYGG
ncbi:hypothetical protein Y032_0142g2296 [Ancylostoma ceylanicum]|uniref:Uncharacterized protein n=1 Tax=Ancylostoma ceylanicum TaxID=53326 RepID=A0A016T3D6_9BILA|nr:hypothetical protein Y032_0142g2296 [Ancylostoma ceylanicum]